MDLHTMLEEVEVPWSNPHLNPKYKEKDTALAYEVREDEILKPSNLKRIDAALLRRFGTEDDIKTALLELEDKIHGERITCCDIV